ncbi:hypothetical protein AKJ41_00500 [candidate division MSBL1 archaeon SCGC-AAA259O05]|uniref:Tryptophan synthase beta chain-like PALP domain-containing protein n=1 Tax=candidate division MSBL1 archaeon SCGC-AAA259O05 TaxID=1698271 RepID=A0A133V5M4_9EURY|nr:hypothetical protein AKJ41_00500 [candidate division MSBL1 archaeon SCGC-AAA259O05]
MKLREKMHHLAERVDKDKFDRLLKKHGVGSTDLLTLKDGVFGKAEYQNAGESIKGRTWAVIEYLKREELEDKEEILAATSSNFGKAGVYLGKGAGENKVYRFFMSEKAEEELGDQVQKIRDFGNQVKFEKFPGSICPAAAEDEEFKEEYGGVSRGKPIAAARAWEETDDKAVNFDQYRDIGNPLAHYLTTGKEIIQQIQDAEEDLNCFVCSLGTCGSFLGTALRLKEYNEKIKLIAVIPEDNQHEEDNHYQHGLRSKSELGATKFWKEAKKIADEIREVSDEDAFLGMLELWERGIPAGISSGTNWHCIKSLENTHDRGIVTPIPDSPERYEGYLRRHLKEVTEDSFSSYKEIHRELSDQAKRERRKHTKALKNL